jgi:hypothetical protein
MTAWDDRAQLLIRGLLSLIVLSVAFAVVLTDGYPDATVKWAYGAIGIILGYWLR